MAGNTAHPSDVAPARRPSDLFHQWPAPRRIRDAALVIGVALAFVCAIVIVARVVEPKATTRSPAAVTSSSDAMKRSEDWLAANLGSEERLVIDVGAVDGLLGLGISDERIVGIPASGPAPDALSGWRDLDYVVSSPSLRADADRLPSLQAAIDSSTPVASFGTGADQVEIRRILAIAPEDLKERQAASEDLRLRAGAGLAGNPNVMASPDALEAMRSGQVDERLLSILATFSVQHHIQIGAFPTVDGEDAAGVPRRIVELDSVDFEPVGTRTSGVAAIEVFLGLQKDAYRPTAVAIDDAGGTAALRITLQVTDLTP